MQSSFFSRCLEHFWPDRGESSLRSQPLHVPAVFDYDLQVIIPVYNTSSYLCQCLDSVFEQQTCYRICVTVINDGSTDHSALLLQQYASRPGIEILTQPNQGLSAARNAGLEHLRAPRVFFLDSDDLLASNNALNTLLELSLRTGADITEGSMLKFNDAGSVIGTYQHLDNSNADYLRGFAWNKIIRAEVFTDYRFPPRYIFEDTLFGMLLFWRYRRWATSSCITYRYRYNTMGLSIASRGNLRIVDSHWVTRRILADYIHSGGQVKVTPEYRANLEREFRSSLKQIRSLHRPLIWLLAWADVHWIYTRLSR